MKNSFNESENFKAYLIFNDALWRRNIMNHMWTVQYLHFINTYYRELELILKLNSVVHKTMNVILKLDVGKSL